MGSWDTHCGDCVPSETMRRRFRNTVTSLPEGWIFQTVSEDGHNPRVMNLKTPGTWFVMVQRHTDVSDAHRFVFTMEFDQKERYILRLKVVTGRCSFGEYTHLRDPIALQVLRHAFAEHGSFPISTWKQTLETRGEESLQIAMSLHPTLDAMCETLLDAVDEVEALGWVSEATTPLTEHASGWGFEEHCGACSTDTSCTASHLYVIELDDSIADQAWFRKLNPGMNPMLPCVYVGQTSHHPLCRLDQHINCKVGDWEGQFYTCVCATYQQGTVECKISTRSSKRAGRFMLDVLLPELYRDHNPVLSDEASEEEHALAIHLREQGYGVWSN